MQGDIQLANFNVMVVILIIGFQILRFVFLANGTCTKNSYTDSLCYSSDLLSHTQLHQMMLGQ